MTTPPSDAPAAPTEDGYVLVFKELEGPDGGPPRTIAFTKAQVRPLGYAELVSARPGKPVTVPLDFAGAQVVETDIADMDRTRPYSAKATLESPLTSRAVSLVKGGWLPPTLAATSDDPTILLDRNLVPLLVGHGRVDESAPDRDFLDLFRDRPIKLNPLLYAMEGEQRRIPDPAHVAAQLAQAVEKLRTALPKARVVFDPAMLQGALGLIEDGRASWQRNQAFLLKIAPALTGPVGGPRLASVWAQILDAADGCGVRRASLVLLAALSAAAVPDGASPAKALLKFRPGYAEADAYNALADLRALELLMGLFALFPNQLIHFCTADRPLALFWTGLQASGFERRGHGFAFDMAPIEALLPGETHDWWRACVAGQDGRSDS